MKQVWMIFAALVLNVASFPAQAATYVVTYSGILAENSFDQTGVFGVAGRNLTGLGYTTVYTMNYPYSNATLYSQGLIDFSSDGISPSGISAVLTIDGITFEMPGLTGGYALQQDALLLGFGVDNLIHESVDMYPVGDMQRHFRVLNSIINIDQSMLSSTDFPAEVDYTVQPSDNAAGRFIIVEWLSAAPQSPTTLASGFFIPQRVTINSVPEPSTWAMLIAGFGVIGATMRRRKSPMTTLAIA